MQFKIIQKFQQRYTAAIGDTSLRVCAKDVHGTKIFFTFWNKVFPIAQVEEDMIVKVTNALFSWNKNILEIRINNQLVLNAIIRKL